MKAQTENSNEGLNRPELLTQINLKKSRKHEQIKSKRETQNMLVYDAYVCMDCSCVMCSEKYVLAVNISKTWDNLIPNTGKNL